MIKPKRVFSISIIKNEMDIIESFVRYNINIFDGIIILDKGSTDDTNNILKQLKNEGIPLFIFEGENIEYNHADKIDSQLLKVMNEFKVDILIPLDLTNFKDVFDLSGKKGIKAKESPDLNFCKDMATKYTNDKINPVVNLLESYEWLSLTYLNLKREKFVEEQRLKSKIEELSLEIYEFYNEKINEKNKFKDNERILHELMSSKSWKLTKPLRKFGKLMRNIKS